MLLDLQGTLYPDVIESCPPPGAAKAKGKSHTIKSHHNVGGLPKDLQFSLIEPLRELFKVRLSILASEFQELFRGRPADLLLQQRRNLGTHRILIADNQVAAPPALAWQADRREGVTEQLVACTPAIRGCTPGQAWNKHASGATAHSRHVSLRMLHRSKCKCWRNAPVASTAILRGLMGLADSG